VNGLSAGRKVHLVVEYPERYEITVNGVAVKWDGLPHYRDIRFLPIDITHLVTPATNHIELALSEFRYAEPSSQEDQSARYGTEIEAVYLVGDFHVQGRMVEDGPAQVTQAETIEGHISGPLPPITLTYLEAKSLRLCEPQSLESGDVTVQGLPFYAGRIQLKANLTDTDEICEDENWAISLERFHAVVAKLEIESGTAGFFVSNPYRLPVSASTKELSITLYSSLRNLLGPHHHESGETVNVRPWYFQPFCGEMPERAENILKWSRNDYRSPNHRDSYACVGFGDVGQVAIRG
jgi:hypothetical protein